MKLLETFPLFVESLFKITQITVLDGLYSTRHIRLQMAINLFMKHFSLKQLKLSKALQLKAFMIHTMAVDICMRCVVNSAIYKEI
jgi:hypothetical protein